MGKHEYTYPQVFAMAFKREAWSPDDFGRGLGMEIAPDKPDLSANACLGKRLIAHTENQVEYYSRQLRSAGSELARVSLLYSGQLEFDLEYEYERN